MWALGMNIWLRATREADWLDEWSSAMMIHGSISGVDILRVEHHNYIAMQTIDSWVKDAKKMKKKPAHRWTEAKTRRSFRAENVKK